MLPLFHYTMKNDLERISKTKPFIDQYNSKEINFLSHREDWEKFEININNNFS